MDSIREHGSPMIKIALVGHKTDLDSERQVAREEGQKVGRQCPLLLWFVLGVNLLYTRLQALPLSVQ